MQGVSPVLSGAGSHSAEVFQPSSSGRCSTPSPVASWTLHARQGTRSRNIRCRGRQGTFSVWRDELPRPAGYVPTIVPGARTVATPLLTPQKVWDRMQNAVYDHAAKHFGAFYSSLLGGITTEPALMNLPIDDHMVHRGHGVSESVLMVEGHLYMLPQHVKRLLSSAELAGIQAPGSPEQMMRTVLDTAAASRRLNGMIHLWLSPGRGDFSLSPSACPEPAFYVAATSTPPTTDRTKGLRAAVVLHKLPMTPGSSTPSTPLAPSSSASCPSPAAPSGLSLAMMTRSCSMMEGALAQMEAEARGADVALPVDPHGTLGPVPPDLGLAIITQEDVWVTQEDVWVTQPPWEGQGRRLVHSLTAARAAEILPQAAARNPEDVVLSKFEQRPITLEDALQAKEVMVFGEGFGALGITFIDEKRIGDGEPGTVTLAIDQVLQNDRSEVKGSANHIAIPYGILSGLRDHMA